MPSIKIFKNKKFYLRFFLATLCFLWLFLGCPGFFGFPFGIREALADTHTSIAAGGVWSTAATWGALGVPATTDDAIIATTGASSVTVGTSTSILNLTINSGAILAPANAKTLTVTGNYLNNGTNSGAGSMLLSGTTKTINGTGTISLTGSFTLTNAKAVNAAATLTFSGPTIVVSAATTVTNNGSITTTTAGGITGGNSTTTIWVNAANSTLNITGPLIGTGVLTASANPNTINYTGGAQTVKATATYYHLTLSGSGTKTLTVTTTAVSGNLTLSGTASTATVVGLTVGGNLSVGAGTTFTAAGFALTVTGTTTVTGASSNLVISNSAGTKIFTGLVTVDTSAVWNNSGNSPITMRGGLTFNGTTFTAGSGIYTFDTTAAQAIGGTTALSIASITVTSPAVLTNSGTLTTATALSGNGGFINGATGTLNYTAATIGVTAFTASAPGNTVNYNGGAQTVANVNYWHLTLSGSGAKTLQASTTTISGDLTISDSATMTDNAAFAVTGTLNYSSSGSTTLTASKAISIGKMNQTAGTIVDNANTISVTGTDAVWIESGTFTATGTISIIDTSAAAKTFAGGNKTYKNLTIAGAASAGAVTITGANIFDALTLNLNSTLTLTAGTTTTINSLSATATAGNTITINSTGAYATFLNNTSNVTVHYVSITNNHATGSVTWDATDNCTNSGGNSGWNFPLSTAIAIKAQNGTTAISTITFPPATPSTEVTGAYNNEDGTGNPQLFGATSLPVVTLVTSTAYIVHITITSVSEWTTVVTDENYYIDTGQARNIEKSTFNTNKSTYSNWGTDVNTGVTLATANANDLYLTIDLSALWGKTGTSTLTILGET